MEVEVTAVSVEVEAVAMVVEEVEAWEEADSGSAATVASKADLDGNMVHSHRNLFLQRTNLSRQTVLHHRTTRLHCRRKYSCRLSLALEVVASLEKAAAAAGAVAMRVLEGWEVEEVALWVVAAVDSSVVGLRAGAAVEAKAMAATVVVVVSRGSPKVE